MANRQALYAEQQRRLAAEREKRNLPIQMPQPQGPQASQAPQAPQGLQSLQGQGPPAPIETRRPQAAEPSQQIRLPQQPQQPRSQQQQQQRPRPRQQQAEDDDDEQPAATTKRVPIPEPISANQAGLDDEQRSLIQRYIMVDDEISVLNATLKAKRSERKELEDEVLAVIAPIEAPIVSGQNIVRAKKKMVKGALNQKIWTDQLAASGQLKDPSKAEQLVKGIYKAAPKTEDIELVISKIKNSAVTNDDE